MSDASAPAALPAGPVVHGVLVDSETRCAHYHSPLDVVALQFFCCGEWFPCFRCHEAVAQHPAQQWPRDQRASRAVLCGVCRSQLRIDEYMTVSGCPNCGAAFNPGCRLHRSLYFE